MLKNFLSKEDFVYFNKRVKDIAEQDFDTVGSQSRTLVRPRISPFRPTSAADGRDPD
jgi:hypothetical protein